MASREDVVRGTGVRFELRGVEAPFVGSAGTSGRVRTVIEEDKKEYKQLEWRTEVQEGLLRDRVGAAKTAISGSSAATVVVLVVY